MKCPKCHTDNADTSKFCGSCAALLVSDGRPLDSLTKTLQTPARPLSKDSLIAGKYRTIEEIGRGGMGVVYKAEDFKLKRPVALKFLPHQWVSDRDARERFTQEARAASALDHPNICVIHEIGEAEDDRMYIAMAFYEGESLREKIKRGPIPPVEAIGIAMQAATGMAKAHQKGIVHRDIKPANILITTDGIVKVVDFGLAKLAGQVKLTREGTTVGTVAYMSPEQAKGEAVDQRTDVWSLGVVLYEMLSGVLPFQGDYEQTLIHSILQQEPERLFKLRKDLPRGLENIVFKALSKKPADRYQSFGELLEDLQTVAEGLEPVRAASAFFRGRILGIRKVYAYPAIAAILILAVFAWLLIFPKQSQAFDSIAVLPIENISGDTDQEAFYDGLHQELINRLASIRAFKNVKARTTMMTFKGTKKKSSEIAKELKVSAIIAVSASRSGDKVRIRFEVIDGLNDKQIPGGNGNIDGEYRNILDLESAAAISIASKVQASLTPGETDSLTRKRPIDPDAYDLYLKAMFIVNNSVATQQSIDKSIQYFERALKIDPDFGLAYAGLAWAYDNVAHRSPREIWAKAKSAAEKALSLDENLALAHVILAENKTYYEWDWKGAEKEYRRALEISPNDATAHYCYALLLGVVGKADEAVSHAARALELDPISYMARYCVINAFMFAGQKEKAMALTQETLRLYPNDPTFIYFLIQNYYSLGRVKEVTAESQNLVKYSENLPIEYRLQFQAVGYASLGEKSKAKEAIDAFFNNKHEMGLDATSIAMAYALLDEKDKAFELLEKELEKRTPGCIYIKVSIGLTKLNADPRYKVILKKMGLEN